MTDLEDPYRIHEDQIKITYRRLEGGLSKAYVSESLLEGTNKWTEELVKVHWSTEEGIYVEEEWLLPVVPARIIPPHIRVQPKKLTRAQRRKPR